MGGEAKVLIFFSFFLFLFFLFFFVVWSALIVGELIVVAWSINFYLRPGEIASLLIASAKILDCGESKSLSSFYGQLSNY